MKKLADGKLKKLSNGTGMEYYIARLDQEWLDRLIELQAVIMKSMEKRELYAGLSREELENVLGSMGMTVGAFAEGRLIGFYSVLFPGDCDYNLGNDIGLPREELDKVMHLEGAGVDPYFRGNSLQKLMARICVDEALKAGKTRYILATVSPYNYPSIDHVFALGLCIRDIKDKYNGMTRYICSRDLECKHIIDRETITSVEGSNLTGQYELLRTGYCGFGQTRSLDRNCIRFGKLVRDNTCKV